MLPRALSFALLLPALAAAAPGEPPADAVLATLPFIETPERNRVYVDLSREGGRDFPLMLDTGAGHSVITPALARSLGVSVRRLKFDPYRRATRLGRDLLFYVDASLTDTGGKTGWEYGLLGGNFLDDYVVEIDFPASRVRLLDPDRFEVPERGRTAGEAVLPLLVVGRRPAAEVALNGARFALLLDTGSPSGVVLDAQLAAKAAVASDPAPGFHFATVWGEVAAELGEAEVLELGPFRFEHLPAIVLPNGWFNFGLAQEGVLGVDVLSQFLVRIDYPRERLWLRRRADWQVTWQGVPWSGWPETEPAAATLVEAAGPPSVSVAARSPRVRIASEALAPARPGAVAREDVLLEVATPRDGAVQEGRLAWVEVNGWAGAQTATRHDVMVVVDTSGSTAWASGGDVDGDGKLGKARRHVDSWRTFNPRHYSSDPGDTVLAAELLATRRLFETLDPVRTRVGLASFADGAHLLAPVGSDRAQLADALAQLAENFGSGMTNLSAALDLAIRALEAAGGKGRQKSVLVLSDGYPTAPGSKALAAKEALARAKEAVAAGVRIYSFTLGLQEITQHDPYAKIATLTGGRYERIESPAAIIRELPRIDLARIASVAIRNLTTENDAQAARVFPDGSFDAFVKLAPGDNRLRIRARGREGGEASLERNVRFEARQARDADEERLFAQDLERLKTRLELRALESGLAREAQQAGQKQRRELDVEIEADE